MVAALAGVEGMRIFNLKLGDCKRVGCASSHICDVLPSKCQANDGDLKFERSHSFSRAFAEALKAKRKALGLSHEKLAMATGLSRSAISMIESAHRSPTLISCHALCEALGETVSSVARTADTLAKKNS